MQIAYVGTENKNSCVDGIRRAFICNVLFICNINSSIKSADSISSFRILISQLSREYYTKIIVPVWLLN